MANRNTSGFGLISAGTVGSTPATQGRGKYYIEAADADDLFQGCVVNSKAGYIVQASSTNTYLTLGVFNGIFYNASTTLKPTWANWYNQPITPANSENITCFVIDNLSTFCRISIWSSYTGQCWSNCIFRSSCPNRKRTIGSMY